MPNCGYFYNGVEYTKEELLNLINNDKVAEIQLPYLNYSVYDQEPLKILMGIDDVESYISNETKIKLSKYNNKVSFSMDEETPSSYNTGANNINISLSEIYDFANRNNLEYKDVLNYFIQHEIAHAVSVPAMADANIRGNFENMLNRARQLYSQRPYVDTYRTNPKEGELPYALQNIEEFIAEAMENPSFRSWLDRIGTQENSLLDRIINYFRELLGLSPVNSMYKEIQRIIYSPEYQNRSNEILDQYPDELRNGGIHGANYIWYSTLQNLIDQSANQEEIRKIFDKIPSAISKLRKSLDNNKEAQDLRSIINSFYDKNNPDKVEDNKNKIESGIDMLNAAYNVATRMERDLYELKKQDLPPQDKMHAMVLLQKQAKSMDLLENVIKDIQTYLRNTDTTLTNTLRFSSQLSTINTIRDSINSEYKKIARPALIGYLSLQNQNIEAADRLRAQITDYDKRISDASDDTEKAILKNAQKRLISQLSLIPTSDTLQKIVEGQLSDASVMDLQLHALALNGNALIQSLYTTLRDLDISLSHHRITQEDKMSNIINKFSKSTGFQFFRDIKSKVTDKITVPVKRVIKVYEDQDGILKEDTIEQNMFISDYDPNYIYEWEKMSAYIKYYEDLRNKTQSQEAIDKLSEWRKTRADFLKEHSEREYKDEYYAVNEILDQPLTSGDVTTTLREVRGELFNEISIKESLKRSAVVASDIDELSAQLSDLHSQFKELSDPYDLDGNEKTGIEKLVADQTRKWYEEREKVGKRVMTEEGLKLWQSQKNFIISDHEKKLRDINDEIQRLEFSRSNISNAEYELRKAALDRKHTAEVDSLPQKMNQIQQVELKEEFYTIRENLIDDLNKQLEKISKVPSLTPYFDKSELESLRKEGYRKISDMAKPYRDTEGIINGAAFVRNKPNSVDEIKRIQESFVELRKSLNKKIPTALYKENKELIDDLRKIQSELSGLTESINSDYYEKEMSKRTNEVIKRLEDEYDADFPNFLQSNSLEYNLDGSFSIIDKDEKGVVRATKIASNKLELLQIYARKNAFVVLQESDWYKKNHFQDLKWGENGMYLADVPIYIWRETRPRDRRFYKEPQPTTNFKVFQVNEDLRNPNYELISGGLGKPKKSSSYYKDNVSKLTGAYKTLHKDLRDFYYDSQENSAIPDDQRLYDILPSVPKTEQENKIALTNTVISGNFVNNIKNWSAETFGRIDEDSQLLQNGSINNVFVKEQTIPYRFNNKMDISRQSSDPFSSLLIFDNINTDVYNRRSIEEVFQTALAATEDTEGKVDKLVNGTFNLKNILSYFKNKGKGVNITQTKEGQSVLNQTIQHMMDTFIYGETRTDATFETKWGTVDGHKVAGKLKKFSSRMIFALKWFGPVKNQLSSSVFGLINTGLSEGFASRQDYMKAMATAPLYIKDLISDFRKVGNKSHFGKSMDYFQVLHGGIYNEYGKKVQWTALGQAIPMLTFVKNSTELQGQVVTFLSISYANQVDLNGKKVPFHEAFETKDGKFQPKTGASINGRPLNDNDINKVIGKIAFINRRLNGAFRGLDKAKFEKNVFGSLAFYLNNFVMPGIKARFGRAGYSQEVDANMKGYYMEGLAFAGDVIKYGGRIKSVWKSLTKEEKRRVSMFAEELSAAALLGITAILLAAGGDDKESLRKNSAAHNYLLALAMGTSSEVQTFIPIPTLGLDEIMRKINSPFAAARQVVTVGKMFGHAVDTMVGSDDAFFKVNGIKDGWHDKGDSKLIADLIKLTGFNFNELSAVDKVVQVKQSQQIR